MIYFDPLFFPCVALTAASLLLILVVQSKVRQLQAASEAIKTRDLRIRELRAELEEAKMKADLGPVGSMIDDIRRDRDRLAQENAKLRAILTGTKQPSEAAGTIHYFEKDIHKL